MHGIGFYSLINTLMNFSFLVMLVCMGISTYWLLRSRAAGGALMIIGMLLQVVHLYRFGIEFMVNHGLKGSIGIYQTGFFDAINAAWVVSGIGFHLFAIGLFLHAKHQRGLQARVDELERILADVHSRER
jgi:hypothetical protein